jgi:hypothetical protein
MLREFIPEHFYLANPAARALSAVIFPKNTQKPPPQKQKPGSSNPGFFIPQGAMGQLSLLPPVSTWFMLTAG